MLNCSQSSRKFFCPPLFTELEHCAVKCFLSEIPILDSTGILSDSFAYFIFYSRWVPTNIDGFDCYSYKVVNMLLKIKDFSQKSDALFWIKSLFDFGE